MRQESVEFEPLVINLGNSIRAVDVFRRLRHLPHCIFLDSAMEHEELGRYSFIAADPFEFVRVPTDQSAPFQIIRDRLSKYRVAPIRELPPFQGGIAGLFSYDLSRSFEVVHPARYDEFQMPAIAMGLYDVVIAIDHLQGEAWLISQGFPETDSKPRFTLAKDRANSIMHLLAEPITDGCVSRAPTKTDLQGPAFETDVCPGLLSNFSKPGYFAAVEKCIEYIYAGDVFQVNLAQRLVVPQRCAAEQLYLDLRNKNPATFAAYFDLGDSQIVSASPERFLKVQNGHVEARPIKGTRPRTSQPEADLFAGSELQASTKDVAENTMIVDLMRNDLSRVCTPDSLWVEQLCKKEVYEYVQHLVSSVSGELAVGNSALDLLRCAFPGGSITGAPKIRAMEIIAGLEPHARGAYCGSVGYLGFDGSMDLNILIRTITSAKGWWQFPVGGGIVAQSDPRLEYEETWHKAEGLIRALDHS